MRYKIGDSAAVTQDTLSHGFPPGTIVTIAMITDKSYRAHPYGQLHRTKFIRDADLQDHNNSTAKHMLEKTY